VSIFITKKTDKCSKVIGNEEFVLVKNDKWKKFNSDILGLGEIGTESSIISVICAVFDLEGFTNFCKQIDPQLAVPMFLKQYLNWFFEQIKNETKQKEYPEGIRVWHDLPFLVKFMGDGLLILWNISKLTNVSQMNIITSCSIICNNYNSKFMDKIKLRVTNTPTKLRCGIAKGNVFSVGNGNDFVGPCINYAARLQKLPGISIAFANRGFDCIDGWSASTKKMWIEKKLKIRGIGDSELIYIRKKDYEAMDKDDKKLYLDP
jgi:hypothetical protein